MWQPRILVGAPTGSLNPQIPSPVYRPSPVAIEIADGIGFGIDGESLVVAHSDAAGTTSIVGHLEDGTYPQRDYSVVRDGTTSTVDGVYDWQDYSLFKNGSRTSITCKEESYGSSEVTEVANGLRVRGDFPIQRYDITVGAGEARVRGYDDSTSARIEFGEDRISIHGAIPERSFEITKTDTGFHVQGAYRFQDFDVTRTDKGFVIQGLYPQQRYVVEKGA